MLSYRSWFLHLCFEKLGLSSSLWRGHLKSFPFLGTQIVMDPLILHLPHFAPLPLVTAVVTHLSFLFGFDSLPLLLHVMHFALQPQSWSWCPDLALAW